MAPWCSYFPEVSEILRNGFRTRDRRASSLPARRNPETAMSLQINSEAPNFGGSTLKTLLAVAALCGGLLGAAPASALVIASGSGAITGDEATQTHRVIRNSMPSTWASPKAYPGRVLGSYFYDLVGIAFAPNASQDVLYEITHTNLDDVTPHSVAYLNSFDPTNIAANYLGDPGRTPDPIFGPSQSYQVKVGAGGALVLNFSGTAGLFGQFGRYEYSVSAFSDANRGENFFAVPEPSTWAMLLAGFGMAGAALRRRRHAGHLASA
jgi:hypothetical protein